MASGEYFLKTHEIEGREKRRRQEKVCVVVIACIPYMSDCGREQSEEVAAERRAKRAEAFVAPAETAAPTVEEKQRKRGKERDGDGGEDGAKRKKKKRKTAETEADA